MNYWADDMLDATTDEIGVVLANVKALVETVKAQHTRIAELEATLANERGEGEPPCEGWEWNLCGEIPNACWHNGESVVYMEHAYDPEPATPAHYWLWWVPGMPGCQRAKTARDGMRQASEMVKQ